MNHANAILASTPRWMARMLAAASAFAAILACSPVAASSPSTAARESPPEALVIEPDLSGPAAGWTIEALSRRAWGSGKAPETVRDLGALSGYKARVVSYSSDGTTLFALVHEPAGTRPERGWPVIVVAHGFVPPSTWTTEGNYVSVTRRYAAGGFLVLKPDYRGHGDSGGSAPGHFRAAAYAVDTLNLVADALLLPGVDPERVFLYGHSMGGSVALVALEVSDFFKAATIWAGVTRPFPEDTLHYLRKRDPDGADAAYAELLRYPGADAFASLSALANVGLIREPLTIRHGTADESVPFEWSVEFRDALDTAGVRYEFVEYPGADHNISQSFGAALQADMEFFRRVAP